MTKEGRRVFFLDREGKEHSNETCNNHDELAIWIIENEEDLKRRFEKSRMKLEIAFLLKEGWIYGTEADRYKEVVCFAKNISEKGKKIIQYYCEEGYKPYDIEKLYGEESLKEFFEKIEDEREQGEEKQEGVER